MKWLWLVLCLGCVEIAEQRAEREDKIGRTAAHGLAISVDEGLAAIRALEPGKVTLWAQAPTLTISLTPDEAGPWTLELRNALPDAELIGPAARAMPQSIPTRKVWALDLPAGETVLRIATADADTEAPWRFIVFADVQDRLDGIQDLFEPMRADPTIRFGLISGDLTENGSPASLRRFQREMEALPFPLYATLGNHELGDSSTAPAFHRLFGRGSFSFGWKGVRFTLLDGASATLAPRTYDKLARWLRLGKDRLHLAVMHIPALDPAGLRNGAFASRAEGHKLLGMMKRAGVDLTIYGHVHTYLPFTNVGIEAFITGGGGAIPERLDGIGRHYLTVEANPGAQTFRVGLVRVTPAQ